MTPPQSVTDYEKVAAELESIAEMLRQSPEFNHHVADRLLGIARDIRLDLNRISDQVNCSELKPG